MTAIREKLVKIGAKVVAHGRYVTFQMAEIAVPRDLFRDILRRIDKLRRPVPAWPERRKETSKTGGEVRPDEAKSTRIRPPHVGRPPYPAMLGIENGSWFPDTACSAIIGADGGGHLGNVD
jgi:hypothetical protein